MILLIGIPSESPLTRMKEALDAIGAPNVLLNQREILNADMQLTYHQGRLDGALHTGGQTYRISQFTGVYARPMDENSLPELTEYTPHSPQRRHSSNLHAMLLHWLEVAPGRIINRPAAMGSNMSKPYQAQLIQRCGFMIPESVITNDAQTVLDFLKHHQRIIYKSISGVRSIVTEFKEADVHRLSQIQACPTQFQQYVEGYDVRVHTIGSDVFATRIATTATDYRYATKQNGHTSMEAFELDEPWRDRCLTLSRTLGLTFAGIDLRITPEGDVYCFEVNPCPVYSYYEGHTGQPIARAAARYLCGC